MGDLFERCPLCGGKKTTNAPMMVDDLNGYTGPWAAGQTCPCAYSPTPGFAKVGLTMGQVDRLKHERDSVIDGVKHALDLLLSLWDRTGDGTMGDKVREVLNHLRGTITDERSGSVYQTKFD